MPPKETYIIKSVAEKISFPTFTSLFDSNLGDSSGESGVMCAAESCRRQSLSWKNVHLSLPIVACSSRYYWAMNVWRAKGCNWASPSGWRSLSAEKIREKRGRWNVSSISYAFIRRVCSFDASARLVLTWGRSIVAQRCAKRKEENWMETLHFKESCLEKKRSFLLRTPLIRNRLLFGERTLIETCVRIGGNLT